MGGPSTVAVSFSGQATAGAECLTAESSETSIDVEFSADDTFISLPIHTVSDDTLEGRETVGVWLESIDSVSPLRRH